MSTVKEVVKAVKAEPPAENAQDTSPIVKSTPTTDGSRGLVATAGNSLSPVSAMPFASANIWSRAPRQRKRNMTGICSRPLVMRFFRESRAFLLLSVRCIMSWSSPVIAITVNTPARNCFQKYSG